MWEKLGSGLGPDKGLVKIRCCSEDTTRPPSWIQLLFSLSVMSDCVTPWTVARWVPLTMGFPRQESWRGLPFPSPGDLPDPGIEPASPALAGRFFTTQPPGKPFDSVTDPLFKTWSYDSKMQATPSTVQEESVLFLKIFIISLSK